VQPNGIVVLDKPEGLSSAQAVGRIKKLFGARKAGHAGTLDPFATGVLVCMLNQATRLGRFLLAGEKTYEAVLHLGIETDTQDVTGHVIKQQGLDNGIEDRLADTFQGFKGRIHQTPPVFSALKHKGVPLYKLARQGRPVQKPARPVHITAIDITAVALPEVHFKVTCSAGTYIRSLCAEIGRELGCGGHLGRLRRTHSSGFGIASALSLDELKRRIANPEGGWPIISPAAALPGMATGVADKAAAGKINKGIPLTEDDLPAPQPQPACNQGSHDRHLVKIVDSREQLLAVVKHRPDEYGYQYCCVFPQADAARRPEPQRATDDPR
jgi:tRNA pseudouridine55 synthase